MELSVVPMLQSYHGSHECSPLSHFNLIFKNQCASKMRRQTGIARFLCALLVHILKTGGERFLCGLLKHILKLFWSN
jgi:hypothetical protein